MRLVLNNFPSTPHLALNTGKMEHELHEMEATVHTLSARIQVRHLNVCFINIIIISDKCERQIASVYT
jgi:hypothetical protein